MKPSLSWYDTHVKLDVIAVLLLSGLLLINSCSTLPMGVGSDTILRAIGRIPDGQLALEGMPTFIVMVEGGLAQSPDDPQLLQIAAQLYSLYGSQLPENSERALILTQKAMDYAIQAAEATLPGMESVRHMSFLEFEKLLSRAEEQDVETLFILGSIWLEWIRVRQDELDGIADIPFVQTIMEKVVQLRPGYQSGTADAYLAFLASLGSEDAHIVQEHFDNALRAAGNKNIMPRVLNAMWLIRSGDNSKSCTYLREAVSMTISDSSEFALFNGFARTKARQTLGKLQEEGLCQENK